MWRIPTYKLLLCFLLSCKDVSMSGLCCELKNVAGFLWLFQRLSPEADYCGSERWNEGRLKRFLWTEWGSIDVLMLHCCVTLWYWHRFNMFKIWLETKFSQVFTKQIFMSIFQDFRKATSGVVLHAPVHPSSFLFFWSLSTKASSRKSCKSWLFYQKSLGTHFIGGNRETWTLAEFSTHSASTAVTMKE